MGRNLRNAYTNAVDLWALGAVVHELLTAEIPFLERYQDLESVCNTPLSERFAELDCDLLYKYCRDFKFPSERLQQHGVSNDGINFVKSLMAANPVDRVSATKALQSPWLAGTVVENRS